MTRINVIAPSLLSGPHLVAEYRELPRVFTLALAAWHKGTVDNCPDKYTLGVGHVRFFYPRQAYLVGRQLRIIKEMRRRGYKPQHTDLSSFIESCPDELYGDWTPTREARRINIARLVERNPDFYSGMTTQRGNAKPKAGIKINTRELQRGR